MDGISSTRAPASSAGCSAAREVSARELLAAHVDRIGAVNPAVNAVVAFDPVGRRGTGARRSTTPSPPARRSGRWPVWSPPTRTSPRPPTSRRPTAARVRRVPAAGRQPAGGADDRRPARWRSARPTRPSSAPARTRSTRCTASPATPTTSPARPAARAAVPPPRWPAAWSPSPTAATWVARCATRRRGTPSSGSARPRGSSRSVLGANPWSPLGARGTDGPDRRGRGAAALGDRPAGRPRPAGAADRSAPRGWCRPPARCGWRGRADLGGLPVEAEQRAVLDAVRPVVESLGWVVDDAEPDLRGADECFLTLRAWQFATGPTGQLGDRLGRVKATIQDEVARGRALAPQQITDGLTQPRRAAAAGVDVLRPLRPPARPRHPGRPRSRPSGSTRPPIDGVELASYTAWMASCFRITVLGTPALSLPAGFDAAGRPVGLQLVGRPGGDVDVLRAASALEAATPGRGRRRPDLAALAAAGPAGFGSRASGRRSQARMSGRADHRAGRRRRRPDSAIVDPAGTLDATTSLDRDARAARRRARSRERDDLDDARVGVLAEPGRDFVVAAARRAGTPAAWRCPCTRRCPTPSWTTSSPMPARAARSSRRPAHRDRAERLWPRARPGVARRRRRRTRPAGDRLVRPRRRVRPAGADDPHQRHDRPAQGGRAHPRAASPPRSTRCSRRGAGRPTTASCSCCRSTTCTAWSSHAVRAGRRGRAARRRARFDAGAVWSRLASGEVTLFMAVPTIYARLVGGLGAAPTSRPAGRGRPARGAAADGVGLGRAAGVDAGALARAHRARARSSATA